MAKVTDAYAEKGPRSLIACDFSPPRSGDPAFAAAARDIDADFICVAYSPGKSVRMDSAAAAAIIKRDAGTDAMFNLATRDMNRLAVQIHLLGAQGLGLENVVVLQGDPLSEKDRSRMKDVSDYTSTSLIEAITTMNRGVDFKGLKLGAPTDFCIGGTVDLSRDLVREAALAHRKVASGADYLITQSVYRPDVMTEFSDRYHAVAGDALSVPVLYGLQVLVESGLVFGDVPDTMRADLESGRPGPEIALELAQALKEAGADAFYVIPPILKGGARDYAAAQAVIQGLKSA